MKLKTTCYVIVLGISLSGCAQDKKSAKTIKGKTEKENQNSLANASSPYLQEHADNPVDWHEWGPEALQKAKKEDKPLIISIGYSACHWCHVMERESFMDSTVAAYMNKNFVSIKVDREERPDIDQVYMKAAQLITGRGGWPLNAVALPDGKPFFAGTYFPKNDWLDVLKQLHNAYVNKRGKVQQQADAVTNGVKENQLVDTNSDDKSAFSKTDYENLFNSWKSKIDFKKGGFKSSQKFPLPVGWEFLLQYHYLTGNEKALEAVNKTLTAMARGGIYDQLGGGFARYATDEDWFAPHFEKMLYDNGQLVSLYAHAYQETQNPLYKKIIEESLDFVNRELTDKNGGFYSSLNADSEGEEGKYYVWSANEIDRLLDPKTAELFKDYYNIKSSGNWENNKNILYRDQSDAEFAEKHDLSKKSLWEKLSFAKTKLMKIRSQRVRPSTDDKILVSWNALMLKGYVDAYRSLGDKAYLEKALKNADFIQKNMQRKDGGLYRNYKDGKAKIKAFLDDYAFLAEAYISLYQVTFDKTWLDRAKRLTDYAVAHFKDKKSGMFYYTSDEAENLIARKMEVADNVIPSSNSVMAKVLYQLGEYFDDANYRETSKYMLANVKSNVLNGGPYFGKWASILGFETFTPFEVALMGDKADEKRSEMQKHYLPTSLFMGGKTENLPLLENKLADGETIIYVCQNRTCKLPVTEVKRALQLFDNTF